MFSKARKTESYGKYKGYSEQFVKYAKNNPHFQKFIDLRDSASDKIEDLKESLETTQNPIVWKIRDVGDRMFAETDTSFALRNVNNIEPDFSPYEFLNELKLNILPVMVQAIIDCDMEFIEQTCVENVLAFSDLSCNTFVNIF
ncbi:hypothetical protein MHBO_000648 [Bonamia ostreae]|uniref:Uncharacterized protein n=1 Tax=Bonamia ostreae TaxID=126728 RepID=A0ABV2AGC9_9EUKA